MPVREVALIVHEGVQALDVAGPLDVFAEANGFVEEGEGYRCVVLASSFAPVRASNGLRIVPDLSLDDADRLFDTVLVAGGPALPGAEVDSGLISWLRRWGASARRYGSVCTGAFPLGSAGLLDGRTVTTHWQNAAALARMFPKARVEPDRIHTRDGQLVTSAGVTAGIDLALALVGEDHGSEIALACAKRLVVVAQRQGGQSQFSPLLTPQSASSSPMSRVQEHVMMNPGEPLTVRRLAEIAGTSARNVARLFVNELGVTPHEFVEGVRLDRARNLLEGSDLALKAVAFEAGFAGPDQMRAAFQRRLGIGPARYRESFRVSSRETPR